MPKRWVPFLGEFEESGDVLVFKGKTIEFQQGDKVQKQALIGKCISDQSFSGGVIGADIKFAFAGPLVFTDPTSFRVAEIIVYHDVKTGTMVTAGLGADFSLFAIRLWNAPSNQWLPALAKGGAASSLKPNTTYHVAVSLVGSTVKLNLDGVDVASATLPLQPVESQVGVFCIGSSDIQFSNFTVNAETPSAFVVMPFTPQYNELYEEVIKDVCKNHGLRPHRADETYGPGVILADIVQRINSSKVVIAEITPNPPNPNVYYEVGYSHALGKPTILIADRENTEKLPFDLSPFRVLYYENSIGGKKRVEAELSRHLQSSIGGNGTVPPRQE